MGLGVDQRRGTPPRSRRRPSSARSRAPRGCARCRPPDPRWCCSPRRRSGSTGRSRAGRTAPPGSGRGSKNRRIPGEQPPPGPAVQHHHRRPVRPAALLDIDPVAARHLHDAAGGTARSGDKVRCGVLCRRGLGFPSWARYIPSA